MANERCVTIPRYLALYLAWRAREEGITCSEVVEEALVRYHGGLVEVEFDKEGASVTEKKVHKPTYEELVDRVIQLREELNHSAAIHEGSRAQLMRAAEGLATQSQCEGQARYAMQTDERIRRVLSEGGQWEAEQSLNRQRFPLSAEV